MKPRQPYTLTTQVVVIIFILASLNSCISQKKIEYMQGGNHDITATYEAAFKQVQRIKPGDELYIRVSSFDDINYNFFGTQNATNQYNYSNEISVSLISYMVDDSGMLYFPILGNVQVGNQTIEEATVKFTSMLSEYFNQPTVLIKFVNKKISVLGEVLRPGYYTYTVDRLKIFEALSMAGDITVNGNRKKAMIIREEDNIVKRITVDLTQESVLASDVFFLYENDIIYIPPLPSRTWSLESIPWQLMLSTITTFILVMNYIN